MFDWLRRLFGKKDKFIDEPTKQLLRQEAQEAVDRIERKETLRPRIERKETLRPRDVDDLRKYARQQRIARQNEERQKATMGYGLKSRNFKPRPAHEKRLFDLRKKPEEEENA